MTLGGHCGVKNSYNTGLPFLGNKTLTEISSLPEL